MTQTLHGFRTAPAQPGTPPTEPLRVVIAERQGLVRAGFRVLLERLDGVVVTADAATSDEAVAATRATRPDVVLMDFDLPDAGGLETTQRILDEAAPGETRVVMLITSETDDAVFGALRAGATGLLLKDAEPAELVAAVRAVAGGDALLAPALARRVVADFLARPERLRGTPEQLEELTAREREVMALVACGLSNEEIAERLVVTRATAKTHVSRALCKLHARDRAQLVVLAYEAGLVRPRAHWAEAAEHASARSSVTAIGRPGAGAVRRTGLHPLAA
jgi:DNA-binding NarL/FixJ family response regulator